MKLNILTTKNLDLAEFKEFTGWEVNVEKTKNMMPVKWNPYFKALWGDFDWIRKHVKKADARAFITSKERLRNAGVKHTGMYDLTDKDGIFDFYGAIKPTLETRAKKNGFTTNEAWILVHELSHGLAQKQGKEDKTHQKEKEGRMKEWWEELNKEDSPRKKLVDALTQLVGLYKKLLRRKQLQPLVKRKAKAVTEEMEMLGHPVRIVEGYRSKERQAELYAQGRTTPGDIVTNAKPGESFHNYGVAVDIVFKKQGYNASKELWQTLGTVGKKHGFKWGGDWKRFKDKPHFEMPLSYSLKDFQEGNVDYKDYN